MGDVHLLGSAVVISGEEICNNSRDMILIDGTSRTVVRDSGRDELKPTRTAPEKKKTVDRGRSR